MRISDWSSDVCSSDLTDGLVAVGAGLAGRRPGDVTVGGLALVEVLLIAQIVTAIIAPLVGNPPTGSLLGYWRPEVRRVGKECGRKCSSWWMTDHDDKLNI